RCLRHGQRRGSGARRGPRRARPKQSAPCTGGLFRMSGADPFDPFADEDDEESGAIDLVIEDDRWLDADLEGQSARALAAVSEWLGMEDLRIVVLGCDDERIAGLNAEFRDKPRPTNVLSWPSSEFGARAPGERPELPPAEELGDIAISYD